MRILPRHVDQINEAIEGQLNFNPLFKLDDLLTTEDRENVLVFEMEEQERLNDFNYIKYKSYVDKMSKPLEGRELIVLGNGELYVSLELYGKNDTEVDCHFKISANGYGLSDKAVFVTDKKIVKDFTSMLEGLNPISFPSITEVVDVQARENGFDYVSDMVAYKELYMKRLIETLYEKGFLDDFTETGNFIIKLK